MGRGNILEAGGGDGIGERRDENGEEDNVEAAGNEVGRLAEDAEREFGALELVGCDEKAAERDEGVGADGGDGTGRDERGEGGV